MKRTSGSFEATPQEKQEICINNSFKIESNIESMDENDDNNLNDIPSNFISFDERKPSVFNVMPRNSDEFLAEAKKLKMTSILNATSEKILTARQRLLYAAYTNFGKKRSFRQCSIVLTGASGSGKSSTINHLFDLKNEKTIRAKVNGYKSETNCVQEYILTADYPKYELKDARVTIIDTPGFNDTLGIKQDACNLHGIRKFFQENSLSRPNLIIVCLNATDNRVEGKNSGLCKSLRCLKKLNIVDSENPNVVGVLTHPCNVLPPPYYLKPEAWHEELVSLTKRYERILTDALGQDTPVVMIENKYNDLEFERPENSDYTYLPGGELQPRNLFEKCTELFKKNNDKLGQILLDACFLAVDNLTIKEGLSRIVTDTSSIKEIDLNEEEKQILTWLQNDDTDRSHIPKEISYDLREKLAFINHGYDVILDTDKPYPILKLDYINKGINILVPVNSSHYKKMETFDTMEQCISKEDYQKRRIEQLGVRVNPEVVKFDMKGGWNLINAQDESSQTYNFNHELCTYAVLMSSYNSCEFTEEFEAAVEDLPEEYDRNSEDCRDAFQQFFDQWGQFVVTAVCIGGSATGKIMAQTSQSLDFNSIKANFYGQIKAAEARLSTNLDVKEELFSKNSLRFSETRFKGGDTEFHTRNTIENNANLLKWHQSVLTNPIVLQSGVKLEPIYTFVGIKSKSKKKACFKAFKDYLSSEYTEVKDDVSIADKSILSDLTRINTVEKAEEELFDSCFPLDSLATIPNNTDCKQSCKTIELSSLNIGDTVLAWNSKKKKIVFSTVIAFADYYHDKLTKFLKIILEDGKEFFLTENHLLLVGSNGYKSLPACNVTKSNELCTLDDELHSTITPTRIIRIETVYRHGCLAPITMEGNLFVNGVLASCYASVKDLKLFNNAMVISAQSVAHFALAPLRIAFSIATKRNETKNSQDKIMHSYIQWLLRKKFLRERFSSYLHYNIDT